MLLGVRLYGAQGKGLSSVTHDLIVATMLQDTLGKPYHFSAISSAEHEIIDDEYVFSWFGDAVASHARVLRDYLDSFEAAIAAGVRLPEPPSREIATAVAAIQASRLRLTARAAGDRVIGFLDGARRKELRAAGCRYRGRFSGESRFWKQDYHRAVQAFALPGVDHYALREPLRHTLVDGGARRTRRSGKA